jgi:hypothetical protein
MKKQLISVGDKITTKKYGRWTVLDLSQNGFIVLVKIRKGKITETFKVLEDKLWS